ncbi:MAG: hypothetical protein N2442_06760 [Spirochaetes bacterium]|nr:hypothetical protein [Spirochaetota bacterium]
MKSLHVRDKGNPLSHVPIGEFLQQVEAIDPTTTKRILKLQKKYPSKTFGQIALEKGYVKDELARNYLSSKGFF